MVDLAKFLIGLNVETAAPEELAAAIERAPNLAPLAAYIREHAIELVAVVVALLAWLHPAPNPSPAPPPPGIAPHDLDDLLRRCAMEGQGGNRVPSPAKLQPGTVTNGPNAGAPRDKPGQPH